MAFAFVMTGPGTDQVERVNTSVHDPGPFDIVLKMLASSMNFHDWVTLNGLIPNIHYPRVPLSDGCGEIAAVGSNITEFLVGDRVLPNFYPSWHAGRPSPEKKREILGETLDGCLQEYLVIPASSVVKAPVHVSDIEASTLCCAGLTAWFPLMEENTLSDKHTVLLQGTGGVSIAALQIAKAVGAKVAITSSSDEKLERCQTLGADYLVNYRTLENWEQVIINQTGGVDITLDTGGQNTLGKSVQCTKDDGFIGVIGVLSGFDAASISVIDVMQKNLQLRGVTVGGVDAFDRYCRFIETQLLKPIISHAVHASEMPLATRLMEEGNHFGKIGIVIPP